MDDSRASAGKAKFAGWFLLSVLCILFLVFGPLTVFADAVYLKNGKVMKGRIVEKTENYIVLRIGDGESAVDSTIFPEDILRIEAQEEYSKKESLITEQIEKTGIFKKAATEESLFSKFRPVGDYGASDIRSMVLQSRSISAAKSSGGAGTEEARPEVLAAVAKSGSGSLSGVIRLPQDWKKNGTLYVYLMEKSAGRGFVSTGDMIYEKIAPDNIVDRMVRYTISGVPSGEYSVFALWDISKPLVEERMLKGGKALINLGLKGDYVGASEGIIELKPDAVLDNINFDCGLLLKEDRIANVSIFDLNVSILDIYYRRLANKNIQVLMSVKNSSRASTPPLNFYIFINDEYVMNRLMSFAPFSPGQEKELDLTPVYKAYVEKVLKEGTDEKTMLKTKQLKIKVVWVLNADVSFEKTIFIF